MSLESVKSEVVQAVPPLPPPAEQFLECEDFDRDAIIAQFLSTCSYASVCEALDVSS